MRAPRSLLAVAGTLFGIWLILALFASSALAEPALPTGFQDEVVFSGLEQPTNFRFSPDGRIFVAEKSGKIVVYDGLEDTKPDLFADIRTEVYDHADRGLLGLALDPNFPQTPYVYALYTYDHVLGESAPAPRWGEPNHSGDECKEPHGADDCVVSGRLVRLTADPSENHALPSAAAPEEKVLTEGWCQQFSSHSIGDLQFGPEGALYASGGDGASFNNVDFGQLGTPPNPCGDPPGPAGTALSPPGAEGGSLRAQNLHNLSGKIIRVDPATGKAWPDNPFAITSLDENTRRIVAYGFRNPFRFAIDPVTGEIYTGNVGSYEIEEIDHFAPALNTAYNSGWPCYEGPGRQFEFKNEGLTVCQSLYDSEPGSTSPPLFYYSHRQSVVPEDECPLEYGSAISGLSFYEGDNFPPKYKGALFFGDSVRGCAWVMFPGSDGRPNPETTERFMRESRIYPGVDIEEGPEGKLYYADLFGDEEAGPGAIHRISYNPGAPTARLTATPPYKADFPVEVEFDASESTDPEDEALEYDWDLDGNGTFETHGGAVKTRTYTEKEIEESEEEEEGSPNRVVAVRVKDGKGNKSIARVTVYPGDSPPLMTIDAPDPSRTWRVGDQIDFAGTALDSEGHDLPSLNFYWSMRIAHCPIDPEHCHKHPLQTFSGVDEGSFLAPEHDTPSYLEITLRAADDRGLAASKTIQIQPRTVDLGIHSDPAGILLTAGPGSGSTPFSVTAIEGSTEALAAPPTAQLNGRTYTWQSWSDGGARTHSVIANESTDYTARYSVVPLPTMPIEPPPTIRSPAPRVRLKSHPSKRTHSSTARLVFESSQAAGGFKCKLDHSAFKGCRSPRVYRRLRPGGHTFIVVAMGPGGQGRPVAFSWTVLSKKPR